MQLFKNSQISTPQCYYTIVMAFRGRKKKAACRFLHNQKAACRFGTSSLIGLNQQRNSIQRGFYTKLGHI
jgi:hypothetical protein